MNLEELEEKISFKFKNRDFLENALIHRSYLNEHPEVKLGNNERLEFLGDAILSFVVSEFLYEKYPQNPEGDLTSFRAAVVNSRSLAKIATNLELGKYLYLSKGEEATGGRTRQYLLANTFEALLGAIYLDKGLEPAKSFIETFLIPELTDIIENKLYKDYKSTLQELSQEEEDVTPTYKVTGETGPDHAKKFRMGVYLGSKLLSEGEGASKQAAEQEAARVALEKWNDISKK